MYLDRTDLERRICLTIHKDHVRSDVPYVVREKGETGFCTLVTLPQGTRIEGQELEGFWFTTVWAHPSKYRGSDFWDIPFPGSQPVCLNVEPPFRDGSLLEVLEQRPGVGTEGCVKVMPLLLKRAVDAQRLRYLEDLQEQWKLRMEQ